MHKRFVLLIILFIYGWFIWLPLFHNSSKYGARYQAYGFTKILNDTPTITRTRGDTYYFSDGVSVTNTFLTRFIFGLLTGTVGLIGAILIILCQIFFFNKLFTRYQT